MRPAPSRPLSRRRGLPVGVLLGVALTATACGTDNTGTAPVNSGDPGTSSAAAAPSTSPGTVDGPQPSPPPGAAPTATAATAAPPPASPPGPAPIEVAYSAGTVSGQTGRVKVPLGERVSLRVLSDTADEVHLHGYDESVAVTAGTPAVLTFQADIPGVFEVELEDLGVQLLSLQVG